MLALLIPFLFNLSAIAMLIVLVTCPWTNRVVLGILERGFPDALFRVRSVKDKRVILTIDDGPSRRTFEILNLLQRYQARATFFVHTDSMTAEPPDPTLTGLIMAGHEVGHHMPRDIASIDLPEAEFKVGFLQSHQRLLREGLEPSWFRPAGGGFAPHMREPMREHGYHGKCVLGSLLPWDVFLPLPGLYARQLALAVFPGAIMVFHDGAHKDAYDALDEDTRVSRTLIALEAFLLAMVRRGYKVCSLGEAMSLETLPKDAVSPLREPLAHS